LALQREQKEGEKPGKGGKKIRWRISWYSPFSSFTPQDSLREKKGGKGESFRKEKGGKRRR